MSSAHQSTSATPTDLEPQGAASRPRRRRGLRLASASVAVGLVASVATAEVPASASHLTSTAISPSSILTVAGDDGGPFPSSENPYGVVNGLGQFTSAVYEPLYQFDWLKPTEAIPWLATKYAWSQGGRVITFVIRPGVKWSDGTPFTAADVAFTYNMIMKNPAINYDGLDITGVSMVGTNQVRLTFAKPAYSQFYYIASQYIVPQHIWKNYKNPSTAQNPNPVGTGPYLVSSFSPQAEIFKPNPNYWGIKPKVPEIVEPDILNNNTCDNYLYTGQAQWGGCFLADFNKFKANKYNVFASSPEELQGLLPNLTVFPTDNLAFRQAVSLTLDRKAIAIAGDLGEEPWTTSPTGLVLPAEKAYLAPQYANLTYHRNIPEARAILRKAGFKWGSNGTLEAPNGTPINVPIKVVAAYSDNVAAAETILQEWKAIGLRGTLQLEAAPALTVDEEKGNFVFAEYGTPGGLTPYNVFNPLMNSALSAPIGKTAVGDFERFKSAAADADLAAFAGSDNLAVQKKAMAGLEEIYMQELPLIDFQYTVAWGEYNTKNFVGWPSPSNPYALGTSYYTPENELVMLNIRPRS
jgi:peptide/nickel transport system substrate-binding protein